MTFDYLVYWVLREPGMSHSFAKERGQTNFVKTKIGWMSLAFTPSQLQVQFTLSNVSSRFTHSNNLTRDFRAESPEISRGREDLSRSIKMQLQ